MEQHWVIIYTLNNKKITVLAAHHSSQSNIKIFLTEFTTIMTTSTIEKDCIWILDINLTC